MTTEVCGFTCNMMRCSVYLRKGMQWRSFILDAYLNTKLHDVTQIHPVPDCHNCLVTAVQAHIDARPQLLKSFLSPRRVCGHCSQMRFIQARNSRWSRRDLLKSRVVNLSAKQPSLRWSRNFHIDVSDFSGAAVPKYLQAFEAGRFSA